MHDNGFKSILKEFALAFDCIKSLCKKLRSILFPLIKDKELDLEIPADPITLYDSLIKAFKNTITGLDADF